MMDKNQYVLIIELTFFPPWNIKQLVKNVHSVLYQYYLF